MAYIKLKVDEKILDKFLWLLRQFKKEDIEIMESEQEFEANKKYLEQELYRLKSGESKSYTVEEADQILEESIKKYEG